MNPNGWPFQERIPTEPFWRAIDLMDAGNIDALAELLSGQPELVRQRVHLAGDGYFQNPTLLEFLAENPIRLGTMPSNAVAIAELILGLEPGSASVNGTLQLVASGRIAREQKRQIPLLETLCRYGADANCATLPAAAHGELAALHALVELGAAPTLPVLTALGRTDEAKAALAHANEADRHSALSLGAQHGQYEIVRALLRQGADPNRYNPAGMHAHSTPLHQAAFQADLALVRLLVQYGARTDLRDKLWNGTPADWALHAGRPAIAEYLLAGRKEGHPADDLPG